MSKDKRPVAASAFPRVSISSVLSVDKKRGSVFICAATSVNGSTLENDVC
jgi:hypothetical protein